MSGRSSRSRKYPRIATAPHGFARRVKIRFTLDPAEFESHIGATELAPTEFRQGISRISVRPLPSSVISRIRRYEALLLRHAGTVLEERNEDRYHRAWHAVQVAWHDTLGMSLSPHSPLAYLEETASELFPGYPAPRHQHRRSTIGFVRRHVREMDLNLQENYSDFVDYVFSRFSSRRGFLLACLRLPVYPSTRHAMETLNRYALGEIPARFDSHVRRALLVLLEYFRQASNRRDKLPRFKA